MEFTVQEVLDKASAMFPSEIAIAAQAVEIEKLQARVAELEAGEEDDG